MGNCIICGVSTDGLVCEVHQEDVVFEFTGNHASQLTPGRFYRGTVDGYAEFGVFIDIGRVTGLLHRSKIDKRLESLDWEVGDDVYVQVNNVRDNGDIDLDWSIRQSDREFRGQLVQTPEGDELVDEADTEVAEKKPTPTPQKRSGGSAPAREKTPERPTDESSNSESVQSAEPESVQSAEPETVQSAEPETVQSAEPESVPEPAGDLERVAVDSLTDRVGETVRLEGELASVRQTSGPTVFQLRDETGVVDCAAFIEAGVRAYPDVDADDIVRLDGEVRVRRDEIQVETDALVALDGDDRSAVETRMEQALDDRARPEKKELLAEDDALAGVQTEITEAATAIRRAILQSRPIVVRHDATADGYVAGAAIERAVLPLIEEQHTSSDAVYHYFDRRPLEDGVYDMNDATTDVTRMLGDRDRHDEQIPLFVFAAAGSTAASADGLELLEIYDAPRVVIDGRDAADVAAEAVDTVVTVPNRTATTVAVAVAAAVTDDVRSDLHHLPAISYWDDAPEAYVTLAEDAGVDAETARQLREAIALEAYYQSYEDKREIIIDLLFEKRTGLAEQVSEQFRRKLDAELDTATANLDERDVEGRTVVVLDTDAYTHRYDFPPTRLLLDELARRLDAVAVVGVATDELHIRTTEALDLEAVADTLGTVVPNAAVANPGARQPKLEFLAGERDAVIDAVVDALADQLVTASA